MTDFLITSSVCLAAFLAFYHLFLEREKMHRFNRFYLLASVFISVAIPFITFEIIEIIPVRAEQLFVPEFDFSQPVAAETIDYTPIILWSLYSIITVFLLIRFGKNIRKIVIKSKSEPALKYKQAQLVLLKEKVLPHTFLNTIFINEEEYHNRNIEEELYTHELTHVTQKHTLDVLLIELLKTIFWFNPLFYFYKKAIQLNHEFLADEKVVTSYNNVPFYQSLLLEKTNGFETIYLASNLNYLITKKRLIMMTKNTSKTIAAIKKVAIVPVLVGLIYFFCVEVVAQEKGMSTESTDKASYTTTDKDKIRDRYYSGVWVKIHDERINKKSTTLYEKLSLEDRRKYLDYIPDMMIEKEIPAPLFENMKTKNMAVWINGKLQNKEEIKKYKRTDFSYYTYSFVHKNARSKRFPQEYQYTLYTKDYFDENLRNSHAHFKGDTIKIGYTNYQTAKKNSVLNITKADTIAWYSEKEDGVYNLYINEDAKKRKSTNISSKMTEVVAVGKEADLKEPSFPGGLPEFYKFIAKNFEMPKNFKSKDKLVASFIVEKDGSLSNIEVKKDLGSGTKEEVIRVLKKSPKWIPASVNNETIRYQYVLPILISN